MSAQKTGIKAERSRARRVVPVLIVMNIVLGLAFAAALAVTLSGPRPTPEITMPPRVDPLVAQADALIASLHCPCAACGHSRFNACDGRCGERIAVRDFVLEHLRSGTDAATVLAHVKARFGDLTSVASAQAAWESMHPQVQSPTPSPAGKTGEPPSELLRFLEQQQDGS